MPGCLWILRDLRHFDGGMIGMTVSTMSAAHVQDQETDDTPHPQEDEQLHMVKLKTGH